MVKISLKDRKRTGEMSRAVELINQNKKEELLSLKLETMNRAAESAGRLLHLAREQVHPDPNQPRKTFRNLESLAKSIKEQGLLQPIVVKARGADDYQIIVGERRFHASEIAGLTHIPAILREEEDADTLILQLLENDQRDQVSPLEEAEALNKLIEKMGLSKQDVAKELGRDAAWISLRLGLLQANPQIKELIRTEKILDLRTLHELRKLSEEEHKLFDKVLYKISELEPSGGYRNLIRETRKTHQEQGPPRVLKVEYRNGDLLLYLEKKRKPVLFAVDQNLLRNALPVR